MTLRAPIYRRIEAPSERSSRRRGPPPNAGDAERKPFEIARVYSRRSTSGRPHDGEPGMVDRVTVVQPAVAHPLVEERVAVTPPNVVAHEADGEGSSRSVGRGAVTAVQRARMEDNDVAGLGFERQRARGSGSASSETVAFRAPSP